MKKSISVLNVTAFMLAFLMLSCQLSLKKPETVENQIAELERQKDSLIEYNQLLLREYSRDGANGKMSRDEAWERAQYMKKIIAKREVIEHKIDSLKLLSRPKK